ncbi:SDR family oxidoreductase [Paenalcaligenes sp. Me131]|uniref:SDR family oxidoreductase n=1 Tax=Paenalcaligenes sp. Me131 TaxID=3392636 RepID=UPI003D2CE74F
MHTRLERSIIVTGGSRGIGAEIVKLCTQAGYDVCFTYKQHSDKAAVLIEHCHAHAGKAVAIQVDSNEPKGMARVFQSAQQLSPLYGLVNNVGITSHIQPFHLTDEATLRHVFDVNVISTMLMSQHAIRYWLQHQLAGTIVNISSIAAKTGSPNEYVHYAASKAAIETFTVGLAKEVATQSIRVNAVSPGITHTDIHALSGEPDRAHRLASRIPMQRAAQASEIAEAVLWLLLPASSYVTGAVIPVAGGL